jgi:hypothetical protein
MAAFTVHLGLPFVFLATGVLTLSKVTILSTLATLFAFVASVTGNDTVAPF